MLIVCLVSLCARGQGEFRLDVHSLADGPPALARAGSRPIRKRPRKPARLKGVPEALSDRAAYFVVPTGSGPLFLAIDLSEPPVLYADTDWDNDLGDEKPAPLTPTDETTYRAALIMVKPADGKEPLAVQLELWAHVKGGTVPWITVAPAVFHAGKATFGETTCAVALLDHNLDGHLLGRADKLALDFNANGDFEYGPLINEIMPLQAIVRVENAYYSVEAEPDGSTIRFKKITPACGTVAVEDPSVRITVAADVGTFLLEPSAGTWALPCGKYKIVSAALATRDEQGDEWILRCIRLPGETRAFEIRESETTALTVGPPFALATDVKKRGRTVSIGLNLAGRAGERYLPSALRNGKMLEPPKLRILDEKGHELAAGAFRYG